MALALPPASAPVRSTAPRVLLVGVGEAGPRVHRCPVDEQPVGVRGRHVRRGAPERARGRRHLAAQIRHAVGLGRRARRAEPLGLPVGGPQRRREGGRRGQGTPFQGVTPRLHRPLVGRVGGEGRPRVGDEGLPGRDHCAAVPHDPGLPRVGPADHDAVAGLLHLAPRRLQRPGERAIVGVDADLVGGPVDREPGGAQRARGRRRQHAGPAQAAFGIRRPGRGGDSGERTGCRGAGGDPGGGGEERAPAEPAHVMPPR